MPENNSKFWKVREIVAKVATDLGLKLSHREMHRVAHAYREHIDVLAAADAELKDQHDPKTYSDPTGEAAVRDWFMLLFNDWFTLEEVRAAQAVSA